MRYTITFTTGTDDVMHDAEALTYVRDQIADYGTVENVVRLGPEDV